MIKPVILWTDALLLLLVFVVIAFVFYVLRKEHLHAPWRRILRGKIAFASLMVLLVYVVIGLLDSIHFRQALPSQEGQQEAQYAGDVLSVLDLILTPLRTHDETTYSAPFAAQGFAKETVTDANGVQKLVYPRLKHGGAHLQNPATEWQADFFQRLVVASVQAVIVVGLLFLLLAGILAARHKLPFVQQARQIFSGKTEMPWGTFLWVMGALIFLVAFIANFAAAFHILGTDKVGQDVLYQAIKSIRTGLIIGTLTTLIMLPFAVSLGLMAGYFRGWVDDVIQYLYTTLNSIPGVLLIAAAILMLQVYMANHPDMFETMAERADMRLLFLCAILGVTSWTGLCRLLRGESLKLKELEYVQAADAFGVSSFRILMRHLLPNLSHLILIAVVLDFSGLVLAEAVLSYVGVGVDPTTLSWGNMINRARLEMAREPMVWWSLFAAFAFMFTLVLSANLFSDAVRDAFDPRAGHN
ncbi:MAG: ABC transporter permease [Gammaproteobacteria bacterium]